MIHLPSFNVAQATQHDLNLLSHKAVEFFWQESNPLTGFTKDRAANFKKSDKYTVSSCASTGFALCAYPIGVSHGWLKRSVALSRTKLTLKHLLTTYPTVHGWCYHFVDWKTGKRMWNCEVSSIDTSILLAGVMDADRYWHDATVHALALKFEKRIDWKWMLTNGGNMPHSDSLCMGWTPEHGWIKARWDSYCELTMLYIQAFGLDKNITRAGWASVKRPIVEFGGVKVVAGGPLFMHEMSHGFYNLKNKRDVVGMDYWLNSLYAAKMNRAYCIANPKHFADYGPSFWGLSACDTPTGYGGDGAPPSPDDGTITPTSAIASIQFDPALGKQVLLGLFASHRGALGRFGFSNGINPSKDWHDPDVIGIDLGMMMLGIDAYQDGMIHRLSSHDPIVIRGMKAMGFHYVKSIPGSPIFGKKK